ncbi:UNVERIFIED_CONTAM: Retrovirus-related Pol polyprotein from transposon [Sesamum calycinum]|uniref:Retrovirus-related Pol polyprotein from transposon n=1 Tax=Sesamum calycinum TaxID=2727403 RepID=A0AAW2K0I3_9LAMI
MTPRALIDGVVWHLDVDSSHPGVEEGPKGSVVRRFKCAGQLSWYGRTAAQREILLYTSSRTRFLNRTSIGERCYNQQEGIYYDETFGPVIKMATEDIKHVALRSPIGIYSTKVMPFGLKNAGATYQRAMTNIFKELLHHEVECYVDDLVLQLE